MTWIPAEQLTLAAQRISPHLRETPLTYDPHLDVFFKWENRQVTGSFKARGAFNKVLALGEAERAAGLVAASAGNHGQGVALAARAAGARALIFASDHAAPVKLEAMRALGAEVRLVAGGYEAAEQAGLEHAHRTRATWVSPYNDLEVIAGQGTAGVEALRQLGERRPEAWVTPVGGGGLACGLGWALAAAGHSRPALIGVQSEASPFLHALFHRGTQEGVADLPSLADGLTGAVQPGSVTIDLAREALDDLLLVSEDEIGYAVAYAWKHYHEVLEGSAAAALAAVLSGRVSARPALLVLTGGNIQPELHRQLVERWDGTLAGEGA